MQVVGLEDEAEPGQSQAGPAALAEVARRLAHEVKNPLTPMKLMMQNFERKFDPNDPNIQDKIELILEKGFIVLNNAKNKLVHQMVAIVRSGIEFDPTYKHPKIAA